MPLDPCFDDLLSDPRNIVRPPPAHVPLEQVRRAADAAMAQGEAPEMPEVRDGITSMEGRDVPYRLYRPIADTALPLILFCHGGGFVWGSIATHDGLCRRIAARTGAAVASVGYRLAPETKFPGPIEDAYGVLTDLLGKADAFALDPTRIALCGDSAGGSICVGVAKYAARNAVRLRHLALLYPALDPSCNSASQQDFAGGPLLTQEAMRWFWSSYLSDTSDAENDLMAEHSADLSTFPETTIATCEFDPLRDEGAAFAARLITLGVAVTHTCYPGMVHGFMSLPVASDTTRKVLVDVTDRLKAALP